MSHVWMNLLAVLMSSFVSFDADDVKWDSVESEDVGGYVVVDRVDDDVAVLETDRGPVMIPRTALPYGVEREGTVLEWRIASEEIAQRLERAHERLEQMQTESPLVIDL